MDVADRGDIAIIFDAGVIVVAVDNEGGGGIARICGPVLFVFD